MNNLPMTKQEADRVMTNCIPQKYKGIVSDALTVIFNEMTKNLVCREINEK
jgi:hypothetical protein